jgi:hypothetical protein
MERLIVKCTACGDGFVIAQKDGANFMDFRSWQAKLSAWLDKHHEHTDHTKTLSQQFAWESDER